MLRKERGLSLEQLAEAVGTSRQTIHRYENGIITNIPSEKVEGLAKALGTTPSSLMGWEDEEEVFSSFNNITAISSIDLSPVGTKQLPMLGNVACGEPIFATEEYCHFVNTSSNISADFCLTAKGDSMINARIFDGDVLFVRKQESVDDGEIAVVLIDDEATVKRVYFDRENSILTLMPENPTYKPMRYIGRELDRIRILGKVVSGQYKI
jgi:repressor LexA